MNINSGLPRIAIMVSIVALCIGAASCSPDGNSAAEVNTGPPEISERKGPTVSDVSGLNPREALALANTWKFAEPGVTSFVDTKKVSFEFPDGEKTTVPLEAKMVVAIAPYMNTTHPCEVHYMSGCQGEMVNTLVKVYGKTADGLVVLDNTFTTMKNGFFELWLARDLDVQLTIEYEGKRASQVISTKNNGNTCITTMQLL